MKGARKGRPYYIAYDLAMGGISGLFNARIVGAALVAALSGLVFDYLMPVQLGSDSQRDRRENRRRTIRYVEDLSEDESGKMALSGQAVY